MTDHAAPPSPPALRLQPLPESEWTDEMREAMELSGRGRSRIPGREADPSSDGGTGSSDFFPTLVRHPKLFKRWLPFGGTLLTRGRLPARDRELLVLRVAWLCQGRVEWAEHVRIAHLVGITTEDVERVVAGADASGWDPFERLLALAVDELHCDGSISDGTWAGLAERYDDQQLIELPMLVGQYHLVAWTQNSLGMGTLENLTRR